MNSLLMISLMCLSLGLVSCTPGTDYKKNKVLSPDQTRIEGAVQSAYLIPAGADVTVRYAENSTFFVQQGATLRAYEKAGKNSLIVADKGAVVLDLDGKTTGSRKRLNVHDAAANYRGVPIMGTGAPRSVSSATSSSRARVGRVYAPVIYPHVYPRHYGGYYNNYHGGYQGGHRNGYYHDRYDGRYDDRGSYRSHRKAEFTNRNGDSMKAALERKFKR